MICFSVNSITHQMWVRHPPFTYLLYPVTPPSLETKNAPETARFNHNHTPSTKTSILLIPSGLDLHIEAGF